MTGPAFSEKRIVLTLAGGGLSQGFNAVSAQMSLSHEPSRQLKVSASLPPAPQLTQGYLEWKEHYLALQERLRIKLVDQRGLNQVSKDRFEQLSQQLVTELNQWLSSPEFQRIDQQLRLYLNPQDNIRLVLETPCLDTQRLPWHLWSFIRDYPHTELALGELNYRPIPEALTRHTNGSVRVLAILGNATGIDIERDRTLLAQLPDAQTQFLVEPSRSQLHEALWDKQGWDILFFAGHSRSRMDGCTGEIAINASDALTIDQLTYALEAAIARGLQLAIFNSCDGLGLAHALAQLNLSQLVVMREPVPDVVAQTFLKYFLSTFSQGEVFCHAVREARQKLQALEDQYLCASWLPIIYQNTAAPPPTWQRLKQGTQPISTAEFATAKSASKGQASEGQISKGEASEGQTSTAKLPHDGPLRWKARFRKAMAKSALVAIATFAVRSLGALQPLEFAAYDLLLRQRPAETTDPRILVVEVTENDTNRYGYPLDDQLLAQLLQKLYEFSPRAVGLDMHRAQSRGKGRELLLEQFTRHPSLSTVCWSGGTDMNYATIPEFNRIQQTRQLTFSDLLPDLNALSSDSRGVIRRQLLSIDPSLGERSYCTAIHGLSLRLAQEFLIAENKEIRLDSQENWVLNKTVIPSLAKSTGAYQNLDGLSSQILINYRSAKPGQGVSLEQVLSGQISEDAVRDRIILIGTTAPIGQDIMQTPLGEMPGVWIHAHQLSQLLSASLNGRPLIGSFPQWGDAAWLLGCGMVAGVASLLSDSQTKRSYYLLFFGSLSGGSLVLYFVSLEMLSQGLWLPLVPSLLVWLLVHLWMKFSGNHSFLENHHEA